MTIKVHAHSARACSNIKCAHAMDGRQRQRQQQCVLVRYSRRVYYRRYCQMTSLQCAITDCGCEDATEFVSVCLNGHVMHKVCLRALFLHDQSPKCPLCRDTSVAAFKDIVNGTTEDSEETSDDDDDEDNDNHSLTHLFNLELIRLIREQHLRQQQQQTNSTISNRQVPAPASSTNRLLLTPSSLVGGGIGGAINGYAGNSISIPSQPHRAT